MSGRSGGKQWSASILRKRGWTRELMRELLPKPRYVPAGSRRVPLWDREDVQAAETKELINKVYDGSEDKLFAALLGKKSLSKEQIEKLKQIVKEME